MVWGLGGRSTYRDGGGSQNGANRGQGALCRVLEKHCLERGLCEGGSDGKHAGQGRQHGGTEALDGGGPQER